MKIGFTGTQKGMSEHQKSELTIYLRAIRRSTNDLSLSLLHGCCIGADAQAHEIALVLGYRILIYPPKNESKIAMGLLWRLSLPPPNLSITLFPSRPYLARNRDIAMTCDQLIACPSQSREINRSGTWATVRYAREYGKPVHIIYR